VKIKVFDNAIVTMKKLPHPGAISFLGIEGAHFSDFLKHLFSEICVLICKNKIHTMEFTSVLQNFNTKLWSYHITVPAEFGAPFIAGKDRRVLCTLNHSISFQCALMPKGDGSFFININKKIRNELGLAEGQQVLVKLEKDESKYGLPMPEELKALLEVDETGNKYFHGLTPGKQRNLLYIVGTGKSEESRIQKAILVIEHINSQKGKIDFKLLYKELRTEV
jgi:hypothetical protein